MQDAKEDVRARLSIEDVIGEYVSLKRAGRNFKGLSPFTSERTASFMVSPEKQIWHDFSSGQGGDIFSFVMAVEGLDFRQALEHLARRAGVDLSLYQSGQSGQVAKRKERIREASQLAVRYYQQSLLKNKHALEYVFKKRGLSKEIVGDFQIGYAPGSSSALVDFLEKRGFSRQELAEAGLTNRFGGDLFRERMMIPLMDSSGQTVGFTGRIIKDEPNAPKYLNTPQTLLYDKSRHVFGLSQAKEAIRSASYTVLVEGNLDVVSSHQAGVKQVIATAGTALTEYHLKTLIRFSPQIRLAFDGDKAGLAATERAIPIAETAKAELSIISLPADVGDPDELIQRGVDQWQTAIDQAEPALDWLLKQYEKRENLQTAQGKSRYTSAGIAMMKQIKDPVVQDHYIKIMSEKTKVSPETLFSKLKQSNNPQAPATAKKSVSELAHAQAIGRQERSQDGLIEILLLEPRVRTLIQDVSADIFIGQARQSTINYLKTAQNSITDVPPELQEHASYVTMLPLHAETRYAAWSLSDLEIQAARLLRQVINENRKNKQHHLTERLRQAENDQDNATVSKLRGELNQLIKEIKYG